MSTEFDFVETRIEPGLTVIESSAGTGKTYAISHLVPRLLLDGIVNDLSQILLVTFTNDAARELSDKVRKVLEKLHSPATVDEEVKENGVFRLRKRYAETERNRIIGRALLDIDRLGVSTIHSFCLRTLQTEGALCGLPVIPELIPDADELIEQSLYDLWKQKIASNPVAAAVASVTKMTLKDNLEFVRFAFSLNDAVPAPNTRPFDEGLEELQSFPNRFTKEVCNELSALFSGLDSWNGCDPGEERRGEILDTLRLAETPCAPGFLDAAMELLEAEKWPNGRTKVGKVAKKAITDSNALSLVDELSALLKRLCWDWKNECIKELRGTVKRALHSNRQITYDGLVEALSNSLSGAQGSLLASRLQERYKIALIDESQDTDLRQFEIFQKVFSDPDKRLSTHRLVLIGDPKQAIYAFRGADVNTYLAARSLAGHQVYHLNKTFRSPQHLVEGTNALFARSQSLLKEGMDFTNAVSGLQGDLQLRIDQEACEGRVEFWIVPDDEGGEYSNKENRNPAIATSVATEIVRILNAKALLVRSNSEGEQAKLVEPGDFAVLVSDRFQAAAVLEALLERNVPAVCAGGEDVMGCDEARDLLAILQALQEPGRSGLRYAALATRLLGYDDCQIRAIRDNCDRDDSVLEQFLGWQATLQRKGVAAALAQIDFDLGVTRRLSCSERGERRITNVRQLTDLLQAACLELGNHSGHVLRWFSQEIARAKDRSEVDERQMQLESDADAVKIVTMHASKGLEYPLVFCPFLWSARKPKEVVKLAPVGEPIQLVHSGLVADPEITAAISRDALEDRLRLAYVAVTRAKARVWISGGACAGKGGGSALDWLLRPDGIEFSEQWIQSAGESGRGLRHCNGIDAVIAAAGLEEGIIVQRPVPSTTKTPWQNSSAPEPVLLPARGAPNIPRPWELTSFSSLTREKNQHGGADLVGMEGKLPENLNAFTTAPGGALVGTAIHDWIEQWDFSNIDGDKLKEHLGRYALPEGDEPMHVSVGGMLNELRLSILPGLGCPVSQTCPEPQASEWHFHLPISQSLSSAALAGVFSRNGMSEYGALLAALPAEQLEGYLHGFIDRLALDQGVWGVVDWKTNRLASGYGQESLLSCAMQSHYLLQAHLYLVALRRYLGPIPQIAGAWLVFLRGIRAGSSDGILRINPSENLMQELDDLFAKPSVVAFP